MSVFRRVLTAVKANKPIVNRHMLFIDTLSDMLVPCVKVPILHLFVNEAAQVPQPRRDRSRPLSFLCVRT